MRVSEQTFAVCLDIIEKIEEQDTLDEVFSILRNYSKSIGGTSLLIGRIENPYMSGSNVRSLGRTDWPEEFFNLWADNLYMFSDPIAHFSRFWKKSFTWSEAYNAASDAGKKILNIGREFDLVNGVAFTVSSGFAPTVVVSLGFDKEPPSHENMMLFELASIHAYNHMLEIDENYQRIDTQQVLTQREREVMHCVAAGKTNWEIGTILGISEKTTIQHITNINKKLNTTNRAQAVVAGVKSGQIML